MSSNVSHSAPTSGVISSGSAPRRVPSTGVPESRASIVTRPNGSSHSAGVQRQRGPGGSAALGAPAPPPPYLIEPGELGRPPPPTMGGGAVRLAPSPAQL